MARFMVNKNDTSDLEKFFATIAAMAAVFAAVVVLGYLLVIQKYAGFLCADISNYIRQGWSAASAAFGPK